ncbi:DNA-binding domain-containing protein [Polaromonas jejuensis]|uniref:DNA-binding domain-containing protein n=1 Tax=Polaromonas jejuensis TaxID=457502 RepID=A0ABW0Q695_9BURK|nr:DNA-binding domain-containing protein [Polaromonas jejuensis]
MRPPAPTLLELQLAIRHSLLGGVDGDASAFVINEGLDPQERIGIYRNTSAGVLVTALRLAFPAVQHVVGVEFFEGAARLFAAQAPPRSAWLDAYGADFPQFLAQLGQAASLPYLPDLARLEWKVNLVLHAADAEPLEIARLATLGEAALEDLRLVPDPATQLLRCEFPADAVWHAVLGRDDDAMAAINLADGPVWLLVQRTGDDVHTVRLSEPEWRVAAALFSGQPLGAALAAASCAEPHRLLAAHLARGCYASFSQASRTMAL